MKIKTHKQLCSAEMIYHSTDYQITILITIVYGTFAGFTFSNEDSSGLSL